MHLPSVSVALTLVTGALGSRHSKRQATVGSIAGFASYLNAVVVYEICTIAAGTFAAAAALGLKPMGSATCVVPINPNAKLMTISSNIAVSGCPNAKNALSQGGGSVGGNTCSPQTLSFSGSLSPRDSTTKDLFTVQTTGGCSGVSMPFMFGPSSAMSSIFLMNEFLFICETGEIVLADPTLHFCIGAGDMGDKRLYSTNDKTCSTTYSLSYNAFSGFY